MARARSLSTASARIRGASPARVTLADLNEASAAAFVEATGWVFEHSPWVAERAAALRPFASVDALHTAMTGVVAAARPEEQLDLLRSHPDLGTRARMSDASVGEQAGAGLDQLTPDQFEQLRTLNHAYRSRFGFPFLLAVKGATATHVLDALSARLMASREQELVEALRQVGRIARFRLEDLIHE